jgi:hypothetical protein
MNSVLSVNGWQAHHDMTLMHPHVVVLVGRPIEAQGGAGGGWAGRVIEE